MIRLKKFIFGLLSLCLILIFVGCSDNKQASPPNLPETPGVSDSDTISDLDAKNYLKDATDIILKKVDKINELSDVTKSDFQNLSGSSLSISSEIETILNSALLFDKERKIYNDFNLKTEILYTNKNSLNIKQYSRFSVDNLKSRIVFSIIEDGLDETGALNISIIEAKFENSEISSICFKCVKTDENEKNLTLYGLEINVQLDTLVLFYGNPSTSKDPISFVGSDLDYANYDDVIWNTYMICKFDFSGGVGLNYFSEIDARKGNVSSFAPPKLFKQSLIDANFMECGLNYIEFDLLYKSNKNSNTEIFEKLTEKNVEYDFEKNEFKVI